jgi:hypothetical protein
MQNLVQMPMQLSVQMVCEKMAAMQINLQYLVQKKG